MAVVEHRSFSSFVAVSAAVVATIVAAIAIVVSNNAASGTGGASTVPTVNVTLSEFAINPSNITVPPGKVSFVVANNGTMEHNFEIKGVAKTDNLGPGQTATLTVTLAGGHYDTLCNVPGHESSGMKGMIMAVEGARIGDGGESAGGPTTTMSVDQMDAAMAKGVDTFLQVNGLKEPQIPIKDFGKGGADLAPTILADGTKEFDLTAEIVDWEVEPGKLVKAWTYNGVVPAPAIHVDDG